MKTAKALGIMIPQSILVRADEVIEQRRWWHEACAALARALGRVAIEA